MMLHAKSSAWDQRANPLMPLQNSMSGMSRRSVHLPQNPFMANVNAQGGNDLMRSYTYSGPQNSYSGIEGLATQYVQQAKQTDIPKSVVGTSQTPQLTQKSGLMPSNSAIPMKTTPLASTSPVSVSKPLKVLEEIDLTSNKHYKDSSLANTSNPNMSPRGILGRRSPAIQNRTVTFQTPSPSVSPASHNRPPPLHIPGTPSTHAQSQVLVPLSSQIVPAPSTPTLRGNPQQLSGANRDRGIERGLPMGQAISDKAYLASTQRSLNHMDANSIHSLSSPSSSFSISPTNSDSFNPLKKEYSPTGGQHSFSYGYAPYSVAISSGTSRVGRAILRALNAPDVAMNPFHTGPYQAPDVKVKAGVRSSMKGQYTPELSLAEQISGVDTTNPATLYSLFQGCQRALIIPAHDDTRVDQSMRMINAAAGAGVKHCVLISYIGSELDDSPISRQFRLIERHLENSGMTWTHLRCGFFMENLLDLSDDVKINRKITLPTGRDRWAPVAVDDVARVAAYILKTNGHEFKNYEITGPEALNGKEIASVMSSVLGFKVKFRNESERKTQRRLREQGYSDWQTQSHINMFRGLHENRSKRASKDSLMLLGYQTPLRDWLQANKMHFGA